MIYHAVLDPEPGKLAMALFRDGKEIFTAAQPMRARDASMLPGFVASQLAAHGVAEVTDVAYWSIGSGPGSFTFLREVAAMAAGWKYGHDNMKFRCIPGAIALAAALDVTENETVGTLYDGRNRELLYFGVQKKDGELIASNETAVLNAAQAAEFFAKRNERLCVGEADASAVAALLPSRVQCKTVAPVLRALAENKAVPFDGDLEHLVYIRPAVEV